MLQINKILVPRDFSPFSDRALSRAIDMAERTGAEIHLVFADVLIEAMHDGPPTGPTVEQALEKRLLKGTEEAASKSGIVFTSSVARGVSVASSIIDYVEKNDIDLIIMGTHGWRGIRRFLLGSTAEELVRTAPCPVMTVRQSDSHMPGLDGVNSILVPIDFSKHSQAALREAKELAALFHTRLDLLHIVEDRIYPSFYVTGMTSIDDLIPDLEARTIKELKKFYGNTKGPDGEVYYHVRHGIPARDIAAYAEDNDCDLIVMSTHGLSGIEHVLLGSVAEKVVRWSSAPVFTLKAFSILLAAEV